MDVEVLKLGGTALATKKDRENILEKIKLSKDKKYIIITSAMGRNGFPYSTDTLLSLIKKVTQEEEDRLLSCGETISSITFSSFLIENSIKSKSLSYLNLGIKKSRKTKELNVDKKYKYKLLELFNEYDVLVIPGFICKDENDEVMTLGRGNSDLSAVIYADLLDLNEVILYKDVEGVYPFFHLPITNFKSYDSLSYEEMLLLIDSGCNIVSLDAIKYAKNNSITIKIKPFKSNGSGTVISDCKLEKKVIGFFVKNRTFDIVTPFPCLIKEEMHFV